MFIYITISSSKVKLLTGDFGEVKTVGIYTLEKSALDSSAHISHTKCAIQITSS